MSEYKTIKILFSEQIRDYDFGEGHPFRGVRYKIFFKFLEDKLKGKVDYEIINSEPVNEEDLLLICSEEYIEYVKNFYELAHKGEINYFVALSGNFLSIDNIPGENPGNIERAARFILGQMKKACDLIQEGKHKKVISIGGGLHHAKPSFGEGFCVYNDIAFGAKYLIEKYSLKRILILDTDAHGGNGTMEYFYEDPRVLFIDIHQDPKTIYPGTGFTWQIGEGDGKGFTVNCPLKAGASWDSYQYIFENIVFPIADEFKPEIIIRYGGSDPYWNDSLTYLGLKIADFKKIGQYTKELANLCDGKVIDAIASGYNEKAIGPGWLSLICGLCGIDIEIEEPEPIPDTIKQDTAYESTKTMVNELKGYLKDYWKCMR
ncbi:MAG: histone deacetylase [Thermodesulfovibrio sp.]|nr:histone deacetylase [Thermodesulfovibrio sp.]